MAWLIGLVAMFAWISGALFWAGLGFRAAPPRPSAPARPGYPEFLAEEVAASRWLRSPRLLIQVGLLFAFIGGVLVLIVLSL